MRQVLGKLTAPGLLVFCGTLALMVSGCASSSSGSSVLPDSQQIFRMPLHIGSLTGKDIASMDPGPNNNSWSSIPISLTFPNLVTLDQQDNVTPWAATAMPVFDSTAKTYTFRVRSGMKWTDGTPIDASTFAYSINRSLSPCIRSALAYFLYSLDDAEAYWNEACGSDGVSVKGRIPTLIGDSILVLDSQTIVFKLTATAPYFLDGLTYSFGDAQPQQLITQYGKTWTNHLTDGGGFGGNLYKVKLWDHTGHLDLIRNDSFWGTPARLREVDFKIYPTDDKAEYVDYLDGKLDQGRAPEAQYKTSNRRSDFHKVPLLGITYYQPNWAMAPFNNLDVRQAFDLALNKEVLADQANEGTVFATNHIVPQGMPGYDLGLTAPDGTMELIGDVSRARQLMQTYAAANCDGQLSKCPPVTLVDLNDPLLEAQDKAAVQMWESAFPGYTIKTSFLTNNAWFNLISSPNAPQIFEAQWNADYPDPQDWLSLQFGTGALNNSGNVMVPAANALMARADADLGPDRMSLYNQAEQQLVNQVAWIPLNQVYTFYNVPSYVHNFQYSAYGWGHGVVVLATWQHIYLTAH